MTIPQLRIRSEFSFRDGRGAAAFGPLPRLIERLRAIGAPAAGLVDGSTWGHTRWAAACEKATLAPLFGFEVAIPQPDGLRPTAWALAGSATPPLYRLSTACRVEGADRAELFRRAAGEVLRFAGSALKDPEAFDYVDINPGSPGAILRGLRLASASGRPLVITSDNAYAAPGDLDAFLAIGGRQSVTPQHILSEDELRAAFGRTLTNGDFDLAAKNTASAAERAGRVLARAPLISVPGDLRAEVERGQRERLAAGHIAEWTPEYEARTQRELDMIELKAFQSYFLVVADLVRWAKTQMLVGPARGSSAGSLVCYLLRITEVDPIVHQLLFERFIDATRPDLPDIDIDFSDVKRDLVFTYLADKYGREHVARIGNIVTLKPRSAIAEVGKRLGIPSSDTFDLANVLIEHSSGDARYGKGLEDTIEGTAPGQAFIKKHPAAAVMTVVENHAWHTGVHAAGVIVCNVTVSDFATVGEDGVAHIDKPASEALNLLKIDALGLRTLGVIEDSGVVAADELYGLKLNDPEVLQIFNQQRYSGLFQFEGTTQRNLSSQVDINSFERIDHVTALARPGPLGGGASNHYIQRAAGREPVEYRHPMLAEVLGPTMGVILYQEQVMRIVRDIGQFSWEETTIIRKAMSGRKGKEFFDAKGAQFVVGAATVGIAREQAQAIWDELNNFGAWGMNRCICGETRVKRSAVGAGQRVDPTIAELYDEYVTRPSAWIRQNRLMPSLMSVGEDGVARPARAKALYKSGVKPCLKVRFSDGAEVVATKDHKFIIGGKWKPLLAAKIGSEFGVVSRKRWIKNHRRTEEPGKGWRKGREGAGPADKLDGASAAKSLFRFKMLGRACARCGNVKKRMEVHHEDHNGGKDRPEALKWLCAGCHKRTHMEFGDWGSPMSRGWTPAAPRIVVSIEDAGMRETYDIEMHAPNHNFILADGLITHNSHTVSYGIISYWCAWMKRYHPLEYAAACLRGAKDDDQAIEVLREMVAEGIEYDAFDIDRSEETWSVKDGRLIGGFQNVRGIGPIMAAKYVEQRRNGTLDEKTRAKIAKLPVQFADLRPAHSLWGHLYADPAAAGVQGQIMEFGSLPEMNGRYDSAVVIGLVKKRIRRDRNEAVMIKRRGGEVFVGQPLFLDMFVVDDSIGKPIIARVGEKMWESVGSRLADGLVDDEDWLLMRGRWLKNFNMLLVSKVRCLTRPELTQ